MSPIHSSRNSSRQIPYGRFTQYPTASPASTQTFIPTIALTELLDYFDVANDQLYDLLDSDTELHRIVHTIELFQPIPRRNSSSSRTIHPRPIRTRFTERAAWETLAHGRTTKTTDQTVNPTRPHNGRF